MKKNQFTKLLQNRIVLAALLIVLMAGTAVAGITAMRSGDKQREQDTPEGGQSGYALETEESDADQEQLALPTEPVVKDGPLAQEIIKNPAKDAEGQLVQSDDVDALLPGKEDSTLADAGDAVIYEPEKDKSKEKPAGAQGTALHFQKDSHITWPVEGNVVLDYSMDSTIYFPTLEQYKCNPGILIQSEVGMPVEAATRGMVTAVGANEEIGNFIVMDLGGDYSIVYGQLKDVTVSVDQIVEAGEVLGYVENPTKYYVVEGPNMYLEMRYQQNPVDPLDYIR